MELLKQRTKAFNEKFSALKAEYDELSDRRSETLQKVQEQTEILKQQTQQYKQANDEYKEAQQQRIDAEFDVYLSLNTPDHLVYSPETKSPSHIAINDNSATNTNHHPINNLCQQLYERHYAIIDDFLQPDVIQELYKEVKLMHMNDELALGETGDGKSGKRRDLIAYVSVDTRESSEIQNKQIHANESTFPLFVRRLDSVVHQICHHLDALKMKTINRGSAMVSCYEKDAYYISHVDNPNHNGRILTALLYMNPSTNGGELKIHRCGAKTHIETASKCGDNNQCILIEPKWNRLVMFWSDQRNLHEVKPTKLNRYAVSIWYLDVKESLTHTRETEQTI